MNTLLRAVLCFVLSTVLVFTIGWIFTATAGAVGSLSLEPFNITTWPEWARAALMFVSMSVALAVTLSEIEL